MRSVRLQKCERLAGGGITSLISHCTALSKGQIWQDYLIEKPETDIVLCPRAQSQNSPRTHDLIHGWILRCVDGSRSAWSPYPQTPEGIGNSHYALSFIENSQPRYKARRTAHEGPNISGTERIAARMERVDNKKADALSKNQQSTSCVSDTYQMSRIPHVDDTPMRAKHKQGHSAPQDQKDDPGRMYTPYRAQEIRPLEMVSSNRAICS
ncbi:hypothetical protein Tco_0153593 [Tanacetum coccineum]